MAASDTDAKLWPQCMVFYDTTMDPRIKESVLDAMRMWAGIFPPHEMAVQFFGGGWFDQKVTATSAQNAVACMLHNSLGEPNVYWIDDAGRVWEASWWDSDWHFTYLNLQTLGPPAAPGSALSSVVHQVVNHGLPQPMLEFYPNVYYFALLGDEYYVFEMCYEGDGEWANNDLTGLAGAEPALPGSALVSMHDQNYDPRVYYISANYHVCELAWWGGEWHFLDLAATTEGGLNACSARALACTPHNPSDNPNVYYLAYVDNNGVLESHVCELSYWDGGWHFTDLTAKTGAPPASMESALACGIHNADYDPNVYCIGTGNHVYEFSYFGGDWHFSDLTEQADGAPDASPQSSLTMVVHSSDYDPNVYYLNAAAELCELSWWGGNWHFTNISVASGGFLCSSASGLASASTSVHSFDPMVFFIDDSNLLNEAWWSPKTMISKGETPRPENKPTAGFLRFLPTNAANSTNSINSIGCADGQIVVRINPGNAHPCHELGHALGLIHEHCRNDRDSYVTVHWENIDDTHKTGLDFTKVDNSINLTTYDYTSTMHYSCDMFSKNGDHTLTGPSTEITLGMGHNLGGPPTERDYDGVTRLYSENVGEERKAG
jgi:astacin (peptidase family M12A)